MKIKRLLAIILLFGFIDLPLALAATNGELADLKLELEKEKVRRETAEEEKKRLAAQLPTSETKPKEGTISADNQQIEVQILSYAALSNVVWQLAQQIPEGRIVICGTNEITTLRRYQSTVSQLQTLSERLQQTAAQLGPANFGLAEVGLGIMAAQGLIKGIADLVGLFKSDITVKGVAFTPDEEAVAALLSSRGKQVIYPKLQVTAKDLSQTQIWQAMRNVEKQRDVLEQRLKEMKEEERQRNSNIVAQAAALARTATQLLMEFHTPATNTGISPVIDLARGDTLTGNLLYVRINAGGGNNVTKKNFWRNPRSLHSGGTVMTYMLFDTDGAIKKGGVLPAYSGYVEERFGKVGTLSTFHDKPADKPAAKPKGKAKDKTQRSGT